MGKYFWPIITGKTFFDTSTVIHLAFWIFAASNVAYGRVRTWRAMTACVALAYVWELAEIRCEVRWPQVWQHPEGALNRWISDPLMAVLGVWLAYWLVRRQ